MRDHRLSVRSRVSLLASGDPWAEAILAPRVRTEVTERIEIPAAGLWRTAWEVTYEVSDDLERVDVLLLGYEPEWTEYPIGPANPLSTSYGLSSYAHNPIHRDPDEDEGTPVHQRVSDISLVHASIHTLLVVGCQIASASPVLVRARLAVWEDHLGLYLRTPDV